MENPSKEFEEYQKQWFIQKDKKLFRERDKKQFKCISIRSKTIIFHNTKIEIPRRYYKDLATGKYVCLLDEYLKIKNHQHIAKLDIQKICKMVAKKKMTFSQATEIYGNTISISTVHRLIKNHKLNFKVNFNTKPSMHKIIYINIDDAYRTLKVGSNWVKCQFKVIQIYQQYFKKQRFFLNQIKAVFINKNKMGSYKSTMLAVGKIKGILAKYYGNLSDYRIIVCGDGARNLKLIAENLGAEFCLDKFHLYNKIYFVLKTQTFKKIDFIFKNCTDSKYKKNYLRKQIIEMLEDGKIRQVIQKLIDIKNNFDIHSSDLNKLINYMKNNLEAIEFWSDPVYCGTFTETFVQQLVKSYFGNVGKWYSLNNFMNILSANCLVNFLN